MKYPRTEEESFDIEMKRVRLDQPSDLILQQSRGHVQQAKPFGNPAGLDPIWIGDASPSIW